MRITLALIDKLIRLRDGETLAAGSLKGTWVEELLAEGVLSSQSHGSRRTLAVIDTLGFLQALSRIHEGLEDLEQMRSLINDSDTTETPLRSEMAAATGNSKIVKARAFPGFLVNSYEPIECLLNCESLVLNPPEGSALFIFDWRRFSIPGDVVVVGIENGENFRFIRLQRELFSKSELNGKRLLFVSRYPQSRDLREWLLSIPNRYVHFGDLDLAGINIYQTEFYRYLGDRASMFLPDDYENRIINGSAERYRSQYAHFRKLKIEDTRLIPLAECINRHHRCFDQEGLINLVSKP